ncbi:MAG: CDP-alcohol phosphatidyltransferase family protein, partial [Thermoplasmata archaeon]
MAVAKPTDGPISRYINRKLSYPISSLIVRKGVPISPNAMSVIALGSAVLAALTLQLWPLMGSVLVQVSSILDGMDGEIARLRGIESKKGAFLDSMLDRLADISIL